MIKVICVGKLKENYLIELVKDYTKRINKYHKLEIIEVKDSDIKSEALEIKKYISNRDYIITLEIEGKEFNSVELSDKINNILMNYGNIVFIIGGSFGLDNSIKDISNCSISFSKVTFPHGLFRGILLEQIYRSFKILNNERYHK